MSASRLTGSRTTCGRCTDTPRHPALLLGHQHVFDSSGATEESHGSLLLVLAVKTCLMSDEADAVTGQPPITLVVTYLHILTRGSSLHVTEGAARCAVLVHSQIDS